MCTCEERSYLKALLCNYIEMKKYFLWEFSISENCVSNSVVFEGFGCPLVAQIPWWLRTWPSDPTNAEELCEYCQTLYWPCDPTDSVEICEYYQSHHWLCHGCRPSDPMNAIELSEDCSQTLHWPRVCQDHLPSTQRSAVELCEYWQTLYWLWVCQDCRPRLCFWGLLVWVIRGIAYHQFL